MARSTNAPANCQLRFGSPKPLAWVSQAQTVVDVGSITGTDGKPVNPLLCGPAKNISSPKGTLPAHSLNGKIALASRGMCPLETKALQAKAAGAKGVL